eukprot:140172-Amorphochlora_amoeboformis.AAC.1
MVAYLALCLLALSARSARVNHDVSQGEAREGVNITSQVHFFFRIRARTGEIGGKIKHVMS